MKKWMYNVMIGVFAAVFLVSVGLLARYYIDAWIQEKRYDELSQMKESVERPPIPEDSQTEDTSDTSDTSETTESTQATEPPAPTVPQYTSIIDPETGDMFMLLPEFKDLYLANKDIVGWITIPGTKVDYPVMQTPDDPDYYLYRNFDKQENNRGCLYIWPETDVFAPSDNVTIYGHHMQDGTMFGQLEKYQFADFRNEHPYVYFDTLTQRHTYEIVYVIRTTATVGEGFPYHSYIDFESEAQFNAFTKQCRRLRYYDSGVSVEYGDKLICLSTCWYTMTNGRFVVIAKQVA